MLTQLYIENIAVISKATIDFRQGFNVFTGETGAGKTILINAINIVLGGRAYRDIIRRGEEKAQVSAVFANITQSTAEKITAMGFEIENAEIMISRDIFADGRSNCKIDGKPCTVAVLKELAQTLLDIHGQHDSRVLLLPNGQIDFVDSFGDLHTDVDGYNKQFEVLSQLRQKLNEVATDDGYRLQRLDMLSYQIEEIESANPTVKEENDLRARRDIIRNSQKITGSLGKIYDSLYGGDMGSGALEQLAEVDDELDSVAKYLDELTYYNEKISEIRSDLDDLATRARDILDNYSFDPSEADDIEARLNTLDILKKKYGGSIEKVLEYYEQISEEVYTLQNSDAELERLQQREQELSAVCQSLADKLTAKRLELGKQFIEKIEAELAYLDMPSIRLELAHSVRNMAVGGQDNIEMLISANPGEPPKPIAKIASGGELSRIMLSIKNVLADRDNIDTIIFDEVDSGVSGSAAYKIGKKLWQVSSNRQILCVTHLAQVAAFADNHMKIEKAIENEKTYTQINTLTREERIKELARITVGENITELALKTAQEMLDNNEKLKV